MAFDRATGKKVWEYQNGRRYENDRGDGPRSTPTVEGDRLYVLGGSGDLTCLENATGKKIWSINLIQKFGGRNPYWGYSESPLIVGDRILVNAGGPRASIVAIAKADGATLWQNHGDEAGYSSPMLMRTGSLNQVIFFTGSRTLAVDPRDGRLLWSYNKAANGTANIATPIVRGTRVFLSSDYGTGARAARHSRRRQPGVGQRGLLHARHAQSSRQLGADRRPPLRLLQQHPHRA